MKLSVKTITVGSALALALAGCGSGQPAPANNEAATSQESAAQSTQTTEQDATAAQTTNAAQPAATAAIQITPAANSQEAAKGAGLQKFGVLGTMTLDNIEFKNPTFGFAQNVAQAKYDSANASLIVRKATDAGAASVSDRAQSEFAQTWTKRYADLDITLWGPAKGAATVATWKDGDANYGVTFQAASGEEVTMDADEVAIIVNSLKGANVPDAPAANGATNGAENNANNETKKATQDTEAPADSGYISNDEAKNAVTQQLDYDPDAIIAEYVDGHYFVTVNEDGIDTTYEIDAETGEVITHTAVVNDDGSSYFTTMTEDGAVDIVENNADGSSVSSTLVDTDEYGETWLVTTRDANGNYYSYYVDGEGNVYEADLDYD